jgi:hypothetical protein
LRYCATCGVEVAAHDTQCRTCGASIRAAVTPTAGPIGVSTAYRYPTSQSGNIAQKCGAILVGTASWTFAGLILTTLGFYGFHIYSLVGELVKIGFFIPFKAHQLIVFTPVKLSVGQEVFLSLSTATLLPLVTRVIKRRWLFASAYLSWKLFRKGAGFLVLWWPVSVALLILTLVEICLIIFGSYYIYDSIWVATNFALPSFVAGSLSGSIVANLWVAVVSCAILGTVLGAISVAAKSAMISVSVCLGVILMFVIGGAVVLLASGTGYVDSLAKLIAIGLAALGGIFDTVIFYKYIKKWDRYFLSGSTTLQ